MFDSLLYSLAIGALTFVSILLLVFAYNLVNGFVMTQNLTEEGRILELCMNLDAYIPNCEDMYGGKNYGDRFE